MKNSIMPEYDGSYLCLLAKQEKCGVVNNYWKVVNCKFNQWELSEGEDVLVWQNLPDDSFEQKWHEMEREILKKMELFDAEKRKKAAQAFSDLQSFIITE